MADTEEDVVINSILTSVKKSLGIQAEYTHFDPDIIMHINAAFAVLTQIGIGPSTGFSISDSVSTWDDFTEDNLNYELVKQCVCLRVRRSFDPPTNGSFMESINKLIEECECRLSYAVDTPFVSNDEEGF